ncbi:F-box protein SKIP19-like [Syzygium oleosum]|uniref:F-box protein SKIP19-like n=1 Tax=Syzygium oleosum TaxID=219896 RepID=UPI0024B9AD39|nr:F-box protein SKIP19-like [Syzygium oleosum]
MATDDPPSCNWLELPREIATTIFLKLGAEEILTTVQKVCTSWRSICKDPAMWRSIDMRTAGDPTDMDHDLEAMCRHAVDRSHGGCVDINVEYFGTNELLWYTTDRCNHIRRLRLVFCIDISDEGLSEAATKLPLLEVLELSYCSFSKEALETVGQCCPLLKSFKLNRQGYRYPHIECDDEAQAIAKNMHELRHLQLFANKMTNEGLKAILDGCPHLEYLDLRQCFNVNLGGNLGKRCTEQIKDLRRPCDPTDDYEFDAAIHDAESSDDDDDDDEESEFSFDNQYVYEFDDLDLSDDDNYPEFSDWDGFTIYGDGYD